MLTHPIHIAHEEHVQGAAPSFAQLWSPGFLLVLVVLGILYTLFTGSWRHRIEGSEPVAQKHRLYFWIGLAFWYRRRKPASVLRPSLLFQHSHASAIDAVFGYAAAYPSGDSRMAAQAGLRNAVVEKVFRFITNPILALFVFNFVFSVYHVPIVMDYLMVNGTVHMLYKVVFLLAAFMMWFPVYTPAPQYDRLSDMKKLAYIFINGLSLTPACALIIFAKDPLYAMYVRFRISFCSLR
ncbi:cytochrome c oxidase assembly protein [Paenibacillus sp. GD4]|uniref:cytochrome c oxidase assembly protein n=1 Tax=Paenibacillus sp. GD4 TaxID=3068890 RepID=UPI002796DEF4|nr:cytochrome c oxidase assembly protein [Paenibacillus sp. GD4]MDQ1911514.1 cytochrome c oxidase assembly protein [Paenibacillus sp. GD4]